jgi:methylated-DNA-protein-cysteine methyltransferase-like protein
MKSALDCAIMPVYIRPELPALVPEESMTLPKERPMDEHDSFPQRVWQIVASIPEGYVTTYGDIAMLAGSPRAARQVGGVLKRLPEGSTLPWYRVVNRHGEISLTGPDLQRQRQALLSEGVQVSGKGKIDMQKYRWVY